MDGESEYCIHVHTRVRARAGADPGFRGEGGRGKVRGVYLRRGVQIGGGEGCAPPARSAEAFRKYNY